MSKNEIVINSVPVLFEEKNNHYFSDSLSIAKVFGKRHGDILRKLKSFPDFISEVNRRNIASIYYIDDNNRKKEKYLLNRDNHILLIMGLTGKEAFKWKRQFIEAFNLMEKIIKNAPKDTSEFKEVDTSNFGEISKANGLHGRVKETRGYFRSDKYSELSVLFGKRTRLRNRLTGLFDLDILDSIEQLDREIEKLQKTDIEKKLTTKVLNEKLIK